MFERKIEFEGWIDFGAVTLLVLNFCSGLGVFFLDASSDGGKAAVVALYLFQLFAFLCYCGMLAWWKPEARPMLVGALSGFSNPLGSFILGVWLLMTGLQACGYHPLGSDLALPGVLLGILIQALAAVPIFRLVRWWRKSGF